jgi:ABC-type transport system substrate-binding protein
MMRPDDLRLGRRGLMQLATGTVLLGGMGAAQAATTPVRGGVLRVAFPANPSNLDPATGFTGNDQIALFPLFDPLIDWDPQTLAARPGMAESWDDSDPHALVLNLRPGLLFHDGTPCDAAAVKYNIERAKTHPRSVLKSDLAAIASVETPSTTRVVLRLTMPYSTLNLLLSDRAGMMSSPTAIEKYGDRYGREAVGTGPWKLVRWIDNEVIEYARNENYWRKDRPYLDGIRFNIIPETNTALRSGIAGENDVVLRLAGPQIATAQAAKNLTVVQGPTIASFFVYINRGRPPLDDVRVRQALSYSLDRQAFNQLVYRGLSEPSWSLLPPQHWAHDPSITNTYPHDPDRARALLTDAGRSGVEINILGSSDQPGRQRLELMADQCSKSGIKLKISVGTIAEVSANFFKQQGDALLSRWTGRPDPSQTWFVNFAPDGVTNPSHTPPSPELAKLMEETRSTTDPAARLQIYYKTERMVSDLQLGVPVVFERQVDVVGHAVRDYHANLQSKPRFDDVWLDPNTAG